MRLLTFDSSLVIDAAVVDRLQEVRGIFVRCLYIVIEVFHFALDIRVIVSVFAEGGKAASNPLLVFECPGSQRCVLDGTVHHGFFAAIWVFDRELRMIC